MFLVYLLLGFGIGFRLGKRSAVVRPLPPASHEWQAFAQQPDRGHQAPAQPGAPDTPGRIYLRSTP